MRTFLIAVLTLLILSTQGECDTKIYTWTDKNGVKQFSDQQPQGVDTYEVITNPSSQDGTGGNGSGASVRPEYERMIREVQNENRQADQKKEQAEKDRQKAEARQAEMKKEAEKEAQRQQIQKKIDALNQRALSPTFSKGMRDSQIKKLQEQMEALE